MIHHIAALVERLAPRLLAASLVFVLAAVTDPTSVGIYSALLLVYTAVQASTEVGIRQLIPSILASRGFMGRYVRIAPLVAAGALLLTIVVLGVTPDASPLEALTLTPILLAPFANARGLSAVGRLQAAQEWTTLARMQLLAGLVGIVVALPTVLIFRAPFAAVLYLPISETVNTLLVRRRAARTPDPALERSALEHPGRDYLAVAGFSLAGWSQGQADRALIAPLGGAALLGHYSVASALARSISDPLAAATANLARVSIFAGEPKAALERITLRGVLIGAAAALGSVLASEFIARPLLPASWDVSLAVIPILALTALPSSLSQLGSVLLITNGRARTSMLVPLTGVLLAPVIAVGALQSLELASWLAVGRDCAVALVAFLLVPRRAPWRSTLVAAGLMVLGAAAVLLT